MYVVRIKKIWGKKDGKEKDKRKVNYTLIFKIYLVSYC